MKKLIIFLVLFMASNAYGQRTLLDSVLTILNAQSLIGLKRVTIIGYIRDEYDDEKSRWNNNRCERIFKILKEDAFIKLKSINIDVLQEKEIEQINNKAKEMTEEQMYSEFGDISTILISVERRENGNWWIELALSQKVSLIRYPKIIFSVVTWHDEWTYTDDFTYYYIRGVASDMMGRFAKDYLFVNPKK